VWRPSPSPSTTAVSLARRHQSPVRRRVENYVAEQRDLRSTDPTNRHSPGRVRPNGLENPAADTIRHADEEVPVGRDRIGDRAAAHWLRRRCSESAQSLMKSRPSHLGPASTCRVESPERQDQRKHSSLFPATISSSRQSSSEATGLLQLTLRCSSLRDRRWPLSL